MKLQQQIIYHTMKQQILAVIILGFCFLAIYYGEQQAKDLYQQWKIEYGVSYGKDEDLFRRLIFFRNVEIINKHNADSTQTYKMGINQFTGLTQTEFVSIYLGSWSTQQIQDFKDDDTISDTPSNDIDWTTKGAVSPVKNQGACSSGWAFSATGVIQSFYKIKHKQSVDLSQQQLIDCSASQGNQGCNGGLPTYAITYFAAHGIATQSEYPYKAINQTCSKNGGNIKISGQALHSSCGAINSALNTQPVSVLVDAANWANYKSGVFINCTTSVNHAALLVGADYGVWKVKNSWGTGWGQQGFIRILGGNTCGICASPGVTVR